MPWFCMLCGTKGKGRAGCTGHLIEEHNLAAKLKEQKCHECTAVTQIQIVALTKSTVPEQTGVKGAEPPSEQNTK